MRDPKTPLTLPASYYVDPNYFKEERERLFHNRWVAIGREEQISKAGDYFAADVGGESLIVTRDDGGTPRAHYNVCRHRGTRLCEKSEGTFKGRITCPYHAWNYAFDGRLMGAPHMEETPGFALETYPLHSAHCDVWEGHLWVNLAKKPKALKDQIASGWDKFSAWGMKDLKLGRRVRYEIQANWKLIVQNYSECLHCPVIHPTLKKLSHYLSSDNEPPSKDYLGGAMVLNDGVDTMTLSGKTKRSPLPGLDAHQKRRVYYYWLPPNLLLSLHPDYMMTHLIVPKRPDFTEVLCELHFHPDEMKKSGFSHQDAAEFWDGVNKEDWHVSELSQLGISSRAYTPGPYSHRESLLHGVDLFMTGALER